MFPVGMEQHALFDACLMETTANIGHKDKLRVNLLELKQDQSK